MKVLVQILYFETTNNNSYFGDTKFCENKIVLKRDVRDNSKYL